MQLPIYNEIIIESPDHGTLFAKLLTAPLRELPCCISLELIKEEDCLGLINNIYKFFQSKSISYRFPYPVYIYTKVRNDDVPIKQILSKNDLPKFFMNKSKRLNPKEVTIQNKNQLKTKLLMNLVKEEKLKLLKDLSPIQQSLKLEMKKHDFYNELKKKLIPGNTPQDNA